MKLNGVNALTINVGVLFLAAKMISSELKVTVKTQKNIENNEK